MQIENSVQSSGSHDDFPEFITRCWQDHTLHPKTVRTELHRFLATNAKIEHLIELSALACHIDAEHLGDWQSAMDYYAGLHAAFPSLPEGVRHRLKRQREIITKALDVRAELAEFDDRSMLYITALALPAATLQIDASAGQALLSQVITLLEMIGPEAPERRLVAIVTANLTCDIVQRYELPTDMRALLLRVAKTSHELWNDVGDASDKSRSAYRLSLASVRADEPVGNGSGRYPRSRHVEA